MYLQIDTRRDIDKETKFSHFINLSKDKVEEDIIHFVYHIITWEDYIIERVRYVTEPLGAW